MTPEDTTAPPSPSGAEYELVFEMDFMGVADYVSPSLHDILEGEPDASSGYEARMDEGAHPSHECNVVDEVDRTPAGAAASSRTPPPQLTPEQLEAYQREKAERLQAW